jgi:glycine oxidase
MAENPNIIVGGGIIGLSIGWRLLRDGAEQVTIFEAGEVGWSAAAWVAAGMLSPRAEAGFEDLDIYEEGLRSLDLYPQFLSDLREDVGEITPSIDRCGTLMCAVNADQARELSRQFEFRKRAGIPVQKLSGEEAREREPLLSTKVTSALWVEQDAQINNRKLLLALKAAFLKRGGILHEGTPISEIIIRSGEAVAVRYGNEESEGKTITVAAGAWSSNWRPYAEHSCQAGERTNDRSAHDAASEAAATGANLERLSRPQRRWSIACGRNSRGSGFR